MRFSSLALSLPLPPSSKVFSFHRLTFARRDSSDWEIRSRCRVARIDSALITATVVGLRVTNNKKWDRVAVTYGPSGKSRLTCVIRCRSNAE